MKVFILTLVVLATATVSQVQNDQLFNDALINGLQKKFKKVQQKAAEKAAFLRDLEKLIDEANAKLVIYLNKLKKEEAQMMKDYRPGYQHKPGEMNLYPVWEEIPAPVPSLPEASRTDIEQKYEGYIAKIETFKKQLADMEANHIGGQESSEQAMMNQTKELANHNAIVQQMGGADGVMQMSEKEREQKAKGLKPGIPGNAAFSSVPDEGMNAMMQKMISDSEYRNAYNKMTDVQKQQELKK